MVKERGAKYLILLSRSGLARYAATREITEITKARAIIEAPEIDICDTIALRALLNKYQKTMPPVVSYIQASMVLRDALFEKISYNDWQACVDPKDQGSWNLYVLLPKNLDFFFFSPSSVS